jgi:CRP-like cAMP-binding protein
MDRSHAVQRLAFSRTDQCRRSYATTNLAKDVVLCIPWDRFCSLATAPPWLTDLVYMGRLVLRIGRIKRTLTVFRWRHIYGKSAPDTNSGLFRFLSVVWLTAAVSHVLACFLFYTSWKSLTGDPVTSEFHNGTWAVGKNITGGGAKAYLLSYYYSFATMLTIGYGDIQPLSTEDRSTSVLVIFTGVTVFSYLLGNVASLIASLDPTSSMFTEKMLIVNAYMKQKNLPQKLQLKVRDFVSTSWTKNMLFNDDQVLSEMSVTLREMVSLELIGDLVRKVSMFEDADAKLISEVCVKMRWERLFEHDKVIVSGEVSSSFYLLFSAKLEMQTRHGNRSLSDGDYFGEVHLFFHCVSRVTAVVLRNQSELLRLDRTDWEQTCRDYPEETLKVKQRVYILIDAMAHEQAEDVVLVNAVQHLSSALHDQFKLGEASTEQRRGSEWKVTSESAR